MMEYRLKKNGETVYYGFSYQDAKRKYEHFVEITDDEFVEDLANALHLAVFISFLKEHGYEMLADNGLIHEMIHLMLEFTGEDDGGDPNLLPRVRKMFCEELKLS